MTWGYNSVVLAGVSVYVNVIAILCALIALPLFIGASRYRLVDKNNLLGLCLLGVAAFLHGGFQTVIRSSPHAVFSGYVLGYSGGSEDKESSLSIYDLGFPPADGASFETAPYRELFLTRSRSDNVPSSFWDSDINEYVKCDYRLWDQQITGIDAVPVPNAKQKGPAAWQWKSHSQGRVWLFLEGLLGLFAACWAILGLSRKQPAGEQSPPHPVRRFPNKWAVRIYTTAAAMMLAWVAFVRVSDRFFQFRAEALLQDIQRLELRKSSWRDAERMRARYEKHLSTDAACSQTRCDITVTLDHWYKFRSSSQGNTRLWHVVWTAWWLAGGRWAYIEATVRVREGVVWGKDFAAGISHREDYPLIATAETTRDFSKQPWYLNPGAHPNIRFGRPGGCEICQALWVKFTPYASAGEVRDAFAFDLSCIGGTLRRCAQMSQVMPVAARRLEQDLGSDASGNLLPVTWPASTIRAMGRDAGSAAVVEVLRAHPEKSTDSEGEEEYVDYRIVETLKGPLEVPEPASLSRRSAIDLPHLPQRAIMFGFERGYPPEFVPLTDDNLREVKAGVAEDAVDIPQKW